MARSPQLQGLAAMIAASTIWGLSSLFYKLLADVPPLEVLAHRTLWSLLALAGVLALQGRARQILACLATPRLFLLTVLASLLIGSNWLGFIYSVQVGKALQASLGYYIFPLVTVILGRLVFGDRLRPVQWVAVALAALAVTILTAGLGIVPRIALMLAVTFALYGALKRMVPGGAGASVAAEVLVLAPFALLWLIGVHLWDWTGLTGRTGGVFGTDLGVSLLLILSGPLTGLPLLLFSYAARRVSLPTVGLVQYLNPTLQFLIAVLIFGEPFTVWHMIAFALIWSGLTLYSLDSLRYRHHSRPPA
ncbi:EamA family transporter RarD [Meridianimarinicoccus sp. MJW13]|uniref:EamA family transporter RarD n=1 Tax=Meridianimarinicoccus sp. MJW13 TaxID=2720031 RepID=UPI001D00AC3E|nr:EamA family transporter RarD [Fluviibacterium sp. MJW13]